MKRGRLCAVFPWLRVLSGHSQLKESEAYRMCCPTSAGLCWANTLRPTTTPAFQPPCGQKQEASSRIHPCASGKGLNSRLKAGFSLEGFERFTALFWAMSRMLRLTHLTRTATTLINRNTGFRRHGASNVSMPQMRKKELTHDVDANDLDAPSYHRKRDGARFSLTHEQGKSLIRKTNPPNAISIPINRPKVPPTSFSADRRTLVS